ncbi:MAG: deoxyribodipyrimidine photolyase [Leptospiraceae bacterium]|nr:deoxyribodipyrimidine photolyase [Leptospiraceae bacterium]MCP5512533.1 deoxyribodipyrimidine photolyase [Leptospiraceae bacterium]
MKFSDYNSIRVRDVNRVAIHADGEYVLYWMQAYRRLQYNHALEFALSEAERLKKPILIYEGLRMDYPWSSERIHQFILEGYLDNKQEAKELGLAYLPYVETSKVSRNKILFELSQKACMVVTDDFPAFITPIQISKLSSRIQCALFAVDSNGIIPLANYGDVAGAARILRFRVHKLFPSSYIHKSIKISKSDLKKIPALNPESLNKYRDSIFPCTEKSIREALQDSRFESSVPSVKGIRGGRKEALRILDEFISKKVNDYATQRSIPSSPEEGSSSLLSPYLHFGNISIDEILEKVLNYKRKSIWAPDLLNESSRGKREGYFHENDSINSFLDELLTWRDIGYLFFFKKPEFRKGLSVLPNWLQENLKKHNRDKREYLYSKKDLEKAKTHDELWNAAQLELVHTGRMHNYLRMLWAKKIIEWTKDYATAYEYLEDLNNKYAYDGRDPNSYTGILWSFGLFDRPWYPERNVFGTIRYMSSDSTKKKFKVKPYLEYIKSITPGEGNLFG